MANYDRDIKTLEDSYKGREYIIHLTSYKIQGYQIDSEIFEKNIPSSELRTREKELQIKHNTLNRPQ